MSTIIHQENTNLFDPLNRGNITISQNLSSSPVNLNGYSLFTIHYNKREVFQVNKYYTVKSIVYLYFIKNVTIFKDILTFK